MVNIRMDRESRDRFASLAKANGMTASELARKVLAEFAFEAEAAGASIRSVPRLIVDRMAAEGRGEYVVKPKQ